MPGLVAYTLVISVLGRQRQENYYNLKDILSYINSYKLQRVTKGYIGRTLSQTNKQINKN